VLQNKTPNLILQGVMLLPLHMFVILAVLIKRSYNELTPPHAVHYA